MIISELCAEALGLLIMTRERRAVVSTPLSTVQVDWTISRSFALLDASTRKAPRVIVYSVFYSRSYMVVPVGGFLSITKVPRRIDV